MVNVINTLLVSRRGAAQIPNRVLSVSSRRQLSQSPHFPLSSLNHVNIIRQRHFFHHRQQPDYLHQFNQPVHSHPRFHPNSATRHHSTLPCATKMAEEYPGWNLDLRWLDQTQNRGKPGRHDLVMYPMGIHYNCYGADSQMLLVREVAMMLVMERLTDKPNWHVKVFDDAIAGKWKAEALAWPDKDLWESIAIPHYHQATDWNPFDRRYAPTMPKNILNQECVDYVRAHPPSPPPAPRSLPWLTPSMPSTVHP